NSSGIPVDAPPRAAASSRDRPRGGCAMTRASGVLVGVIAFAATASAQPKLIEIQHGPLSTRLLEENLEQLDAHLDVKRAYVRAAEVGLAAAKAKYNRLAKGVAAAEEVDQAKHELDAAQAHLDIRKAELREVEVRHRQVKKRL